MQTGVNLLRAIPVTLLAVPATLFLLLNVLVGSFYTVDPPSGSDAMGLIVPLIFSAIGSVLMMIAAWICVATGALDWISRRPLVPFAVATAVTFGVCLAAVGLLIAWAERMGSWVIPAGIAGGAIAPIVLGGMLVMSVWRPRSEASKSHSIAGAFLASVAVLGLALGAFGSLKQLQQSSENRTRVAAAEAVSEAEWARKRARSPIEALREDYAEMSPEAPLWVFVASLPDHTDAESRQFIINRALQVPDFEASLGRTITGSHPRYRHGCADLIRFAPEGVVRSEWSSMLSEAIVISAEQIAADPDWLTPDEMSNPAPVEHIRAMSEAASRVGVTPELEGAIEKLRGALSSLPAGPLRDQALGALASPGNTG